MANDTANIDPRYLTYNKDEVQQILGSVAHIDDTPTADSNYPVKSGAVAAALAQYTTTTELTALLDAKQDATPMSTEQDIRAIVTDYTPDTSSSSSSDSGSSDSSSSDSSDSSNSDSSSSDSGEHPIPSES